MIGTRPYLGCDCRGSRDNARGFNGSAAARLARSAKPCPCRPRQIGAEGTTLNCKRSDDSVPSDVAMNLLAKACGTQCRARSAESRLHRRRSDRPQAELIERAWQREKAQRAYPAESVSFIGRGGVSTRALSSNELQEPLLVCAIQCIECRGGIPLLIKGAHAYYTVRWAHPEL